MILILSNHLDLSTQNVCKWLKYEGTDFYYLGIEYFFKVFKGELGDSAVNECLLNIKNAKVIWNRKWVYGVLDASISDEFKNNVALIEKYPSTHRAISKTAHLVPNPFAILKIQH